VKIRNTEWQPDAAEIAAAVDERTRVIVVTNPGNPTGAILKDDARTAIVAAAQRTGAWILADEVYRGAELNGVPTPSFFGEYERVIATGSLSKAYGLPGLRLGWAVAPESQAARLWARKDYLTISPGELTDRIGAIALHPEVRPRILERTRGYLREGLDVLEPWLQQMGAFTYRRPEAGAILYARYDFPLNSSAMAEQLRADHGVLIVPGDHFGMDHFVRIGFGGQKGHLAEALARFRDYLLRARALLR
jgi:aspartate/methionine/tyrosine aminotransferase